MSKRAMPCHSFFPAVLKTSGSLREFLIELCALKYALVAALMFCSCCGLSLQMAMPSLGFVSIRQMIQLYFIIIYRLLSITTISAAIQKETAPQILKVRLFLTIQFALPHGSQSISMNAHILASGALALGSARGGKQLETISRGQNREAGLPQKRMRQLLFAPIKTPALTAGVLGAAAGQCRCSAKFHFKGEMGLILPAAPHLRPSPGDRYIPARNPEEYPAQWRILHTADLRPASYICRPPG